VTPSRPLETAQVGGVVAVLQSGCDNNRSYKERRLWAAAMTGIRGRSLHVFLIRVGQPSHMRILVVEDDRKLGPVLVRGFATSTTTRRC
jgi:hypothetical protein